LKLSEDIMRRIIFLILFCGIIMNVFTQNTQNEQNSPITLNESFVALDNMLSMKVIEDIKTSSVNNLIRYHMSLGMWIRNNWIRHGRTSLIFRDYIPMHMDDMSQIIIIGYHYYLNGIEKTLEELLILFNNPNF
jgi:hypothetical protein